MTKPTRNHPTSDHRYEGKSKGNQHESADHSQKEVFSGRLSLENADGDHGDRDHDREGDSTDEAVFEPAHRSFAHYILIC